MVFCVSLQIDDVIDEIISLESSYDELLSFGPAEGGLQLPNTVCCSFKGLGGGDYHKQRPFHLGGGRGTYKPCPMHRIGCNHSVGWRRRGLAGGVWLVLAPPSRATGGVASTPCKAVEFGELVAI